MFQPADLQRDRAALRRMNLDYIEWIAENIDRDFGLSLSQLLGAALQDYTDNAIDKLCEHNPPELVFYTILRDEEVCGMGGLRQLSPGVFEVKRIYVDPSQRGSGLGQPILSRLMDDARQLGAERVKLETGPFMKAAHRLYEAAGFRDTKPYSEAEVPRQLHDRWRFMERPV